VSHTSGFRRNDHDTTHRPPSIRQRRAKASQTYEQRLQRRHLAHERERAALEQSEVEER